jgi:hypothetical protein
VLRARTKDTNGNELGTFSDDTCDHGGGVVNRSSKLPTCLSLGSFCSAC